MKIINKSVYETELLNALIDFINKDLNVDVKEITFKTSRTLFRGQYQVKRKKIIVCTNPIKRLYPYKIQYNRKTKNLNYYNGYLNYLLLNPYESLIHVLAHELRHVWQEENRKNRDKWIHNSYGKFSNKDADSFAIKKTREARRIIKTVLKDEVPITW